MHVQKETTENEIEPDHNVGVLPGQVLSMLPLWFVFGGDGLAIFGVGGGNKKHTSWKTN